MEGKRKASNDGDVHGDDGGVNGDGRRNDILFVPVSARGRKRSFPPPFLMKTFEMVEDPETNSIISWSPTNTSFIIWDQIKFTTEVLHKHFRHNNFSSFVYQLNNYGFKKVSWENFEYQNPWFQSGKKHLLENIKRRNQQYDYNMVPQQSSYGSSDDILKDGMEEQLETVLAEQHTLKVEIQKLNQQQKDMEDHLNKLEEKIKVAEIKKGEMISQLLVQHFIQNLREKREMSRNEITKKQKLDESECKKMSVELAGEGDNSRLNVDHKEQVQEELIIIQPEGQKTSSPDDSGNSNQDQKATTASEHGENWTFWKQMMEEDSERENGGEDQAEHHPKVMVKLEDLIGSNTLVEEENLVESPLDKNVEEGN